MTRPHAAASVAVRIAFAGLLAAAIAFGSCGKKDDPAAKRQAPSDAPGARGTEKGLANLPPNDAPDKSATPVAAKVFDSDIIGNWNVDPASYAAVATNHMLDKAVADGKPAPAAAELAAQIEPLVAAMKKNGALFIFNSDNVLRASLGGSNGTRLQGPWKVEGDHVVVSGAQAPGRYLLEKADGGKGAWTLTLEVDATDSGVAGGTERRKPVKLVKMR